MKRNAEEIAVLSEEGLSFLKVDTAADGVSRSIFVLACSVRLTTRMAVEDVTIIAVIRP